MQDEAEPVLAEETQMDDATRTAQCGREIADLLRKHGCVIVPRVAMDQVGSAHSGRFLLTTEYGIAVATR